MRGVGAGGTQDLGEGGFWSRGGGGGHQRWMYGETPAHLLSALGKGPQCEEQAEGTACLETTLAAILLQLGTRPKLARPLRVWGSH